MTMVIRQLLKRYQSITHDQTTIIFLKLRLIDYSISRTQLEGFFRKSVSIKTRTFQGEKYRSRNDGSGICRNPGVSLVNGIEFLCRYHKTNVKFRIKQSASLKKRYQTGGLELYQQKRIKSASIEEMRQELLFSHNSLNNSCLILLFTDEF